MSKIVAYYHGACEPQNPGGTMGFGAFVIRDGREVLSARGTSADGETNSGIASYAAVLAVLDHLETNGLTDAEIDLRGNSVHVTEQIAGRWQPRNSTDIPIAEYAIDQALKFKRLQVRRVRNCNNIASGLSRQALTDAGVDVGFW
jgi:ribonuclease HI